jgi:hypothetical protein
MAVELTILVGTMTSTAELVAQRCNSQPKKTACASTSRPWTVWMRVIAGGGLT